MSMKVKLSSLGLGLAVALVGASIPLGAASAAPRAPSPAWSERADASALLTPVQYVFRGRNYCWYDDAWYGPGWYWCGYGWRRGYGWGGYYGWNRWRGGHPRGWYTYHGGHWYGPGWHGGPDHGHGHGHGDHGGHGPH